MKKHFTNLRMALVGFLVCLMSLSMMAQTPAVILDFSTNDVWGIPAGPTGSSTTATYTNADNYSITLSATTKYGWYDTDPHYLLLGKQNSTLTFPAFDFPVEKIVVVGKAGASGSTKQNIFVGEQAVSTETTGATGSNEYLIDGNYQAAGTIYVLKVTSNHNTQITSIEIYAAATPEPPTPIVVSVPTFAPEAGTYTAAQNVTITCATEGAAIYYTLDGSAPTASSTLYENAIEITETTTINAIAILDETISDMATATYTIEVTPVEPDEPTVLELDSIATLPYAYNFEDVDPYFMINNGEATNAWYIGQAQTFDNKKLYISSNGGTTNKYDITAASTVTAYRDVMIPATGAVLSFDYRVNGQTSTTDYLKVDLNGTEIARLVGENDWASFSYDISGEMAGEVRIQFTWVNNATNGNQFPAAIDNISVIETPCSQPTNLAAAMDSTTAVITWEAIEGQTAWNFQYKLADHSEWYTVPATATTVTLNDLQGNSNYNMRVQAVCGENVSAWTNGTFAVACQTETVVTTQDDVLIGNGTSTNSYLPFYGTYNYTYSQQIIDAAEINATNGSVYSVSFNCSSAPASTSTGNIKIWMANTTKSVFDSNTDYIDPANLTLVYEGPSSYAYQTGWNTFTFNTPFEYTGGNLVVAYYEGNGSWNGGSFYVHSTTTNKSIMHYNDTQSAVSYTSPATATGTKYFNKYRNNMKLNMDVTVVTCDDQIACVAPTGLQVSDITPNSAVLTWTAGAEGQTNFIVEYQAEGATEWTSVDVNDTTYTLTELAQLTNYSVKVKANCGDNNWSEVVTASFRTNGICPPVTNLETSNVSNTTTLTWEPGGEETAWLVQFKPATAGDDAWTSIDVSLIPMTTFGGLQGNVDYDVRVKALCDPENEENQSEWATTSFHSGCAAFDLPFAEEFPTNTMPICWENEDFHFASSGYAYSYTNGAALITPAINIPAENPTYLTFEVRGAGNYTVLASYRGTRADRFAEIYTGTAPNQNTIVTIAIDDLYKGRAVNFKIVNNSTSYQYFYNVAVNQCPFKATALTVADYTGTTVDLEWETNADFDNVEIQYGEQGFELGEGLSVAVNDTTATIITNLNYETAYDFYVRVVCEGDNGAWVGPVTATTAPACSDPENLSFDFTAAQLHWNAGEWGTPAQYNVRYKGENDAEYNYTTVIPVDMPGYTPFVTISGLASNATYEMGVQSVCGENMESNWVILNITTPCMPLTEIPYTQDFEGDVFPPECWSQEYVAGTQDWDVDVDATYGSGSNDATFAVSEYDLVTKLVTPAFDLSSSSNLILTFKHSQAEWAGDQDELRVYYRTSMNSNWVLLQAYTSSITSMTLEEIAIPAAAMSSSCQFAFEATGNYGHGVFLDDMTIKPAPTCGTPSISVNGLTATITPNELGTPASYELMIGEQTATVTTTTVDLSTEFTLEGSTTYQVSVRTNCGGEDYSDWSAPASFTTPCMPVDLPFVEEFESTTFPPSCWTRYKVSGNGNSEWNTTTTHHGGSRGAYIPDQSATTLHNLVTPKINIPASGALLKFWVKRESNYLTKEQEGIKVLYGANEDGTGATELVHIHRPYSMEPVEAAAGWYEYSAVIPAGQYHVIFQGINEYGGATYMDDINIDVVPSCMYPSAITVGTVTETTAQVSWTAGGTETEWEVSYTVNDQTVTETTTNNPYTINGLSASTHYVIPFGVKAICSATDESEVASTDLSFNTACGLAAVPFAENFDAYTGATSQSSTIMPACWNRKYTGTSTSYGAGIYNGSSYAVSGTNSLRFYNYCTTSTSTSYGDIYAVLPQMNAAINTLMMSFDAKKYSATTSYGSHFEVGVVTDASNPETSFTTVEAFNAIQEHGGRITVMFNNYTGSEGYIAFRSTKERPTGTYTYNYVFIDNILVERIPTCFVPTALTVSEVTDHTAAVNWADSYDQAAYAVEYMAEGDATWTSVSVDTTYALLNNLQASTNYTVRVKAVCGTEDESEYTDEVEFTTVCEHGLVATIAGTGGTTYYLPIDNFYHYSYTQQIIDAEEIGGTGTISTIAFEYNYSSPMTKKTNAKIYMGITDKTEFTSTSDWVTSGLQEVYSGALNCSQGWNEFALTIPFAYTGGNVVVVIEDMSDGYDGSAYIFKQTSTSGYKGMYYHSDSNPFTGSNTASGRTTYRSNIKLVGCPEATDLAITDINTFADACDVEGAVTIGVKNMGYEGTVSTFEAYYQMNEETPVHESVTLATPIAFNEATTYTFNQLPVFAAGENIITAWVELTGDLADGNNTKVSDPITVLDPIAVPYEEAFTGLTINHGWNPIDANNDGITMNLNNDINYTFNDEAAADDWMMSPCIEMAAGTYTIIYDYKANSSLTEAFEVFYGNGAHVADMTNAVATHSFNNTTYETATTTITIAADGIYNFGFHATSLAGNLGFSIDNFKVYPVNDVIVTCAANGTVTPNGTIAVNYGEDLTLNLVPDPMYHVAGVWVDDVQVVPEDGTGANFMLYTLENVTEPHTVFVDFKLEFHIFKTVENFRADLYSDLGGAFVPAATDTTIDPNAFTVNMVADPHYHMVGLTVSPMVPDMQLDVFADVVDNGDGTYSYTIDTLVVANYYLNAIFRRDTVAINYNVLTGKGYANDSPLLNTGDTYTTWIDYSVNNDVDTTISFTGHDLYHVADVTVNGTSMGHIDSYTFENVTETQTVDIKFGYKIDASVRNYNTYGDIAMTDPQGTIEPATQYIPEFDPMTVTGTVAEHFHLYQLLVNGENRIDEVVFGADNSYSFSIDSVVENCIIEAVVKVDTFAITYNVLAGQGYADASELLVAGDTYNTIVNYGDNWYSNIVPATGYSIENVLLDGQNLYTASNNQFNFIVESHVFDITFEANTYTITTNAYGAGSVTNGMTFTYDPANPVDYVFNATPEEGYYVSAVIINNEAQDLTGVEGTYTTTIENVADNYVIDAHFSIFTYTMTAEAGEGGTITPAGAQTVNYGTDVTYEINANEGWYIASTDIDGVTTTYTQDDAVVTLTIPYTAINADHNISVTFAQFMYTITATAGTHGTVNGAEVVSANIAYGSNYALTFTPDANYQVADVVVDGVTVGAVDSYEFINVTANHTVEVSFEAIMYTLTATSNMEGCTITPATTTVQAGSNVSYTLSAASGCHLLNVIANGEEVAVTNNAFTITDVQSDYTIFANFAPNYVTVTVNQPAHATITPGTQTYAYGATPSYMIVPEVGYEVVSVTAGNAVVNVTYNNGIGTFTLAPVQADITVNATVNIKKFEITVTQGANGTIAPGTQTNVEYGSNKTFTITPNQYYVIADVIVDGSSRGAISSYTFYNVAGNHTITAVFEANCQTPTNLTAMDIDTSSAVLSWVGTAPSYEVRYKAADAASYTTQTVTTTSLQLTGLTPNTLYEYGVRAICGANLTSDWAINAFTTKALPIGPVDGIANAELSSIKVYSYLNNVYIVNEEGIAISNVDIYDIYGKQVYTGKVLSSPEVISLSVANGNYVVRLATENGVGVYKVAIVR